MQVTWIIMKLCSYPTFSAPSPLPFQSESLFIYLFINYLFTDFFCSLHMKPWCSLAALICKRCSKSQERAEPGAALSSRLSSLVNPPTQRKVRIYSTISQFVPLIFLFFHYLYIVPQLPTTSGRLHQLGGRGLHGDASETPREDGRTSQGSGVGESLHRM